MTALIRSAAILADVSKRAAGDMPQWLARIANVVSQHGKLKLIADAAGMTSSQLLKIANGTNHNPGIKTLERIASAMGVTLSELMAEPRPEQESGRVGAEREGHSLLERALKAIDAEVPADDSVRGDITKAIAVLNRALFRDYPGAAGAPTRKTGR